MTAPHETDRFRNAASYTVVVTYTVAGGARVETAHRRARRVAERVAAATARLADVVDASAVAGAPGIDGQLVAQQPVHFDGANTGRGTRAEPDRLDRYVDPDHELGLVSLADANRRQRQRREADTARRRAIGCANAYRSPLSDERVCTCVYCQPDRHLDLLTDPAARHMWTPRCICSRHVDQPGAHCTTHTNTEIVVLDDDPEDLQAMSDKLGAVTTVTPNYEGKRTDVTSELHKQPHGLAPWDAHPRSDAPGDGAVGRETSC